MHKSWIELRRGWLEKYFVGESLTAAIDWLVASEGKRPVVLVGAGFSLNARDRATGRPTDTSKVPLWSHVGRALADDLGVEAHEYDVPTLCDLYRDAFQLGHLQDRLRGLLKDDEIVCGSAHRALGLYNAEAVITTNNLDSLLDKCRQGSGRSWNRRIMDSDLSSACAAAPAEDLVYFHGHRDHPDTWVMSRAEYEDVHKTKPVMVSRVRQLLAQHPLLVVGFSMADSNFHNVYRLLGTEMRDKHPLGLAIIASAKPTTDAVRAHWRKLGVRIADIPTGVDYSTFFEWMFKHLETNWSPSKADGRAYVEAANGVDRLTRAGVLFDSWRDAQRTADHYARQEEDFCLWRDAAFGLLTAEQHQAARENAAIHARGEEAGIEESGGTRPQTRTTAPGFKKLPADWVDASAEEAWKLDALLEAGFGAPLAEHFARALGLELYDTQTADFWRVPLLSLTVWLVHQYPPTNSRFAFERVARDAHEKAARYGDTHAREQISKLAAKHNIAIENLTAPVDPDARLGLLAMLNADYGTARSCYQAAADRAELENRPFDEWAYASGAFRATWMARHMAGRSGGEVRAPTSTDQEQGRARVKKLSVHESVRTWRERAEQRALRALEQLLTEQQNEAELRDRGTITFSNSSDVHEAWRSLRDLQVIDAPPQLQKQFARPLIRSPHGAEDGFDRQLFDIILRFGTRTDAKRFGRPLSARRRSSVDAQQAIDTEIMTAFFESTQAPTKTDRIGLLEMLVAIRASIRTGDVARLDAWFREAHHALGVGTVDSYSGSHSVGPLFAGAFSALAGLTNPSEAFETFKALKLEGELPSTTSRFFSKGLELPWLQWVQTHPSVCADWLSQILSLPSLPSRGVRYVICDAALTLLQEAASSLGEDLVRRIQQFCVKLHESSTLDDHLRQAGLFIEAGLHGDAPPWEALLKRWSTLKASDEVVPNSFSWLAIGNIYEAGGKVPDALANACAGACAQAGAEESGTDPEVVARLLVWGLSELSAQRAACAAGLIRVVKESPRQLEVLGRCLLPQLWGAQWSDVLSLMEGGSDDLEWRLGMIELVQNRAQNSGGPLADPLEIDSELRRALDHAMRLAVSALGDERSIVANRAAFAVVAAAATEVSSDGLLARALRRIATDSRVVVRMAAAYGSALLADTARSELIRKTALELQPHLRDDPNALVATRFNVGLVEAAALVRDRASSAT